MAKDKGKVDGLVERKEGNGKGGSCQDKEERKMCEEVDRGESEAPSSSSKEFPLFSYTQQPALFNWTQSSVQHHTPQSLFFWVETAREREGGNGYK